MRKRKINKNKLLIKLLIISIISIILGLLYIAILNSSNKQLIGNNLETFFTSLNKLNYTKAFINCIISNLLYVILIWILGISIIGIFLIIFIVVLKSFSLGFTISSIIYFYKLKGILLACIYMIPLIINLFIIIVISYYGILFSKNLNKLLFLKKEISFRNVIKNYIKILLIVIIGILISSILEIYVVPLILKLLI